jgi:hypothetical protein
VLAYFLADSGSRRSVFNFLEFEVLKLFLKEGLAMRLNFFCMAKRGLFLD